jgi:N-acyl-D-amino-acid deacylase
LFDLVIKNARVFDGTGAPWFRADVAIKDGYIAKVGDITEEARKTIDADGKYLSPGFIDAHSHSDPVLVTNPTADSKIMQGVTLEVIGQCGSSAAPRRLGYRPDADDTDKCPDSPDWADMASYLKVLEDQGVSINVVPLVGHGSVRKQVMGSDNRLPSPEELTLMKKLVSDAMEQGAFGISTGLIYVPGTYSDTNEVIELAKVVAGHKGIYFTHIRNEEDDLIEAIEEAIKIGFEADIPVQVSHFKVKEKRNWGKVIKAIALIEEAREKGLDITADQYPYTASSTDLSSALPSGVWGGGREEGLKRFKDPSEREKIIEAISDRSWPNLVIADLENEDDMKFIGKSVQEIAESLNISPEDACLDLLGRNGGSVRIVNFAMCEEDVSEVMKQPWVMVGSDGSCLNVETATGQPHPRNYGTFARILATYVREKNVLRLEEAIRKMTSLPAMRLGLQDRGILREGMRADLVLFDDSEILDKATFLEPHQYAVGVYWVLVNGTPVVEEGRHTGKRPGMVLRHV